MKILILIKKWKGGVGRVISSIKPLLEKEGHEVKVISREDDLKCYSLKDSIRGLNILVNNEDYDILYTQDWSMALPLIFKRNHYVCFHGLETQNRFLQKLVYKLKSNKTIVVGDKLKEAYPNSRIVYNGVDKTKFKDLHNERKYLGWIKRDYERNDEISMNTIARKNGIELSIAENIKPEKMNEWYNSLKIFASYPKPFTGFNICWIEALASGVPDVRGNDNGIGITKAKSNFKKFTWENSVKQLMEILK